jgi:hemerythrin-like domain-containing protein
MAISIGNKIENDYTTPLGMLSDCHRRIERFLNLLITITESVQGEALSGEQQAALTSALQYFRQSAPKHTLDEEESLFPRLRACENKQVKGALARLDSLHADHLTADEKHKEVDALSLQWLNEGSLTKENIQRLRQLLKELHDIYQQHIGIEDSEIFPLAGKVLNADELARIGREMARRRGVDIDLWKKLF